MSSKHASRRRINVSVALVIGIPFLAFLGVLTLAPTQLENRAPVLLDRVLSVLRHDLSFTWLGFTELEIIANVLVFIPVGLIAAVLLPRRVRALAFFIGPALSVGIELFQAGFLPERAATVSDVVANSVGATIGVCLTLLISLIRRRTMSAPSPTLETP